MNTNEPASTADFTAPVLIAAPVKWTLTNADCIAAMRAMPDKAYDLAIVDPPYGLGGRVTEGGKEKNSLSRMFSDSYREKLWDVAPNADYFSELMRVSRNQIIWGGNYFTLPPTRGIVCWDKKNHAPNFSRWEMAWTSFDSPAKMYEGQSIDLARFHPTQKPVALYKWLLKNYARAGDKILDTHGGSCSSVIAAIDMGFSIDAYELDPDYYAMALKRIQTHELQPRLIPTEQP